MGRDWHLFTAFGRTRGGERRPLALLLLPDMRGLSASFAAVMQTEKRVTVEGMTEITLAQGKAILFKVYSASFPFEYQK